MNTTFAIILNLLLPFVKCFFFFFSSQVKFSWFRAQQVFHKRFNQIFLRHFLLFKASCWDEKRWKSLGARSSEYGGWGRIDQPNSNIFPAWYLLNLFLCYQEDSQRLSHWRVWGIFLENFHTHVVAVENISLHCVPDCCLKTHNE